MAAPDFPPLLVRAKYLPDGKAFPAFMTEVKDAANQAKRAFKDSFGEIGSTLRQSLSGATSGQLFDIPGLRKTAADADLAVQKLRAMRDAAQSLARSTGDTSAETTKYVQALTAQVREAEQAQRIAAAQAITYERLQEQISRTAAGNQRLANSYRAVFAEQAKAENYASRYQGGTNQVFAPGLTRKATDNGAGSGALAELARYQDEAEKLRGALDPAIAAQRRFDDELARADKMLELGTIGQREYAAAVALARSNLQASWTAITRSNEAMAQTGRTSTMVRDAIVGNSGAVRTATLQAGQQMQDVAISLYSGQRASVVFAQQLPQLAFALTGLAGSASKTQATIGRVATTLAGPWGLAVGLAAGGLFELGSALLSSGNSADKTGSAIGKLKDRLDLTKNSYRALIAVVQEYNKATERTEAVTLKAAAAAKKEAEALLTKAKAQLAALQAANPGIIDGDVTAAAAGREGALSMSEQRIKRLEQNIRDADRAIVDIETKGKLDPVVAAQQAAEKRLQILEEEQSKGLKSTQQYAREKLDIEQQTAAKVEALQRAKRNSDSTSRRLSPDDVGAMLMGKFGGTVTSTTGGKHAKRSYHYAGQAVDFVPRGGAGSVSKDEVRAYLQEQGVKILELFGPGDRGHARHLHVAFAKSQASPEDVAARIKRQADALKEFGSQAAEQIASVNDRFNDQPKLIDQAAAATRNLSAIIAELGTKRPAGFKTMIADAENAKTVIADALVRPFRDLEQESQRRLKVQTLITQGYEADANALQTIWQIEDRLGSEEEVRARITTLIAEGRKDEATVLEGLIRKYPELKRQAVERAHSEEKVTEALRVQQRLIDSYLSASQSIRGELESIFSGEGNIGNFQQIFKRLNAEILTEQLFGSMFKDLDQWVRNNSGLGRANDQFVRETEKAGNALSTLTDQILNASDRLAGSRGASVADIALRRYANDNPNSAAVGAGSIASMISSIAGLGSGILDPITVVGQRQESIKLDIPGNTVMRMTPQLYMSMMTGGLGSVITRELNRVFGTQFFGQLEGVLSGGLYGNAIGGTAGGILGIAKGLGLDDLFYKNNRALEKQFDEAFGNTPLDKLLKGTATGTMVAGLGNSLGIGMSNTGAQIGGAIGSVIPVVGPILGSIAGGIFGKLLSSPKWATTAVGMGGATTGGNQGDWRGATGGAGASIISGLNAVADRLGGTLGQFAVSVGLNDGNWHVSTTGRSGRLRGNQGWADVTDYGKDQDAALRAAISDAISDGAIQGVRAGTQAILRASKDVDKGVEDALDFESIFSRLKEIKDPVGAALDTLDKDFTRMRGLAITAGEGMVELEELYGVERARVIKEASERALGGLRGLYDSLTVGDTGLSLRERLGNAQAAFDPLAARLKAGDRSAYDDFASASETLRALSQQIYGSGEEYFAFFDSLRSLTKGTIDRESDVAALAANRDSPFSSSAVPSTDNASVVSAIDAQTKAIIAALTSQGVSFDAMNDNLGTLIQLAQANGTNGGLGISYPGYF